MKAIWEWLRRRDWTTLLGHALIGYGMAFFIERMAGTLVSGLVLGFGVALFIGGHRIFKGRWPWVGVD